MRFAKILSCAAAIILLASCGCSQKAATLSIPSFASGTAEFTTVNVTRGDIAETLTGEFYFRSLNTVTCRFLISGTLATKPAVYYKDYKKGDVLATLAEKDDYALAISKKNQEIAEVSIELKSAEEANNGGGEVQLLKLKYQQEKNKYDSMKAGGSSQEDLEKQKYTADKAELTYRDAVAAAGQTFASRSAELSVKQAELKQLQTNYDACTLRAPMSGECIFITTADIGGHIDAYSEFLTMADPSQICIAYNGSITTSTMLALGDNVTLTVNSVSYPAKVVQVPETQPADVDYNIDSTVRLYFLEVKDFDYTGKELGYTISNDTDIVLLTVNEHKDVLLLPTYLISGDAADGYTVNLLVGDTPITKPVAIGLQNGNYTEITGGLNEGDQVVVYS